MVKYIRMDDYPHGMPNYNSNYKTTVKTWVNIFEKYNINYILGVSPLLLKLDDILLLKQIIKKGKIVMHGFNHKFDHFGDWNTVVNTWPHGGEFMGLTNEKIREKYIESNNILSLFETYDPKHFIPPFNCITQELLDVLDEQNVSYIHTCNKEYEEYNYKMLNFKRITPIVSKYHKGYDHVHEVINKLDHEDLGQITLHWIFDSNFFGWIDNYEKFAKLLNENIDYTREW